MAFKDAVDKKCFFLRQKLSTVDNFCPTDIKIIPLEMFPGRDTRLGLSLMREG